MFVGMEGPMVHIGAILGASVARWYSLIIGGDVKWSKSWSKFHVFTNVCVVAIVW